MLALLCNGLSARGHAVTLASFDAPGVAPCYPLDPGVTWVRMGIGDASARSGTAITLRRAVGLRRILGDLRPDAAVGFMHSSSIPLAVAAPGFGIPLVFSEHIVPAFYRDRRFEYLAFLLGGRFARRIVVLSERFIPLYPRSLAVRMVAIPNPVQKLSDEVADARGDAPDSDAKVLLSVGRLEAQKDHETLIRAFAGIAPGRPDWRLRIVGDGSLRARLEALIADCGLVSRVELVPRSGDIAGEYLQAQAYCVPSRYESFGLATAEALSAGLPAVGFNDCPGTNELIRDGIDGLLVAGNGDRVGQLGLALARLMDDGDLRAQFGAAGPEIRTRFDPAAFVARWEGLLQNLPTRTGTIRPRN